jgi:hypothetical protein
MPYNIGGHCIATPLFFFNQKVLSFIHQIDSLKGWPHERIQRSIG